MVFNRFDFSGRTQIESRRYRHHNVTAISNGNCDAILMWWDLNMDEDGDIVISCAPYWAKALSSEPVPVSDFCLH